MSVCGFHLTGHGRYLEERVDGNRRFMRVAVQPKFGRKWSGDFWKEVQQLVHRDEKCRINALQTWFPLLNRDEKEGRHWRDAIGRFVYVFDRIFATKDLVEPKVCHALSHAKRHQDGAASAIEDGAAAEGAGSRKKRQRKHKE